MCGIAAIVNDAPEATLPALGEQMLTLIGHRGPDSAGVVAFDGAGPVAPGEPATVVLAANRLAIQDLSAAGRQPMADGDDRFWIIFNGEIYNHVELRTGLEQAGETFRSRCDTEVLLRLLARRGPAALDELDGMFAFVLLDRVRRTLLIVRDRFGIKPLYWWSPAPGAVRLASEIKAFTADPAWRASVNGPRSRDFLARGIIDHTDETLFDGVRQIPAGHRCEIDLAAGPSPPLPQRWFALAPTPPEGDPETWPARCRGLLAEAVGRRLRSDVPVGSCLSGGIDSSAIVCLVAETLARREGAAGQTTVTARSSESDRDEWPFARVVAEHAGAEALTVTPDADEFFAGLPDLVWAQDEPFSSPSIFAQHKVFETAAAHGLKVMLDGQGADEQLAGYHAFHQIRLLELLRGRLGSAWSYARILRRTHGSSLARQLAQTLAAALPVSMLHHAGRWRMDRAVLDLDRLDPSWIDPFARMTGRRRGVTPFSIDQLAAGSLPMLLHWEDRSSMIHSVEARVPFLSPPLVAFTVGLPSSAKLHGPWTKVVLRDAMRGCVPEPILARTDKIAFEAPARRWLCETHRGETHRAVDAAAESSLGLVTPGGRTILHAIVDGERPYDDLLFRVICFGTWMRRFDVGL